MDKSYRFRTITNNMNSKRKAIFLTQSREERKEKNVPSKKNQELSWVSKQLCILIS